MDHMNIMIGEILVYSNTVKEHAQHLGIVLQARRDHQLYAKFEKCELWLKEVRFLGPVSLAQWISVDPNKLPVVR